MNKDVTHIHTHTDTHTHNMEYCSAMKKNEILPYAARWIYLENISEISVMEKEKFCISLLCGI